MFIMVYYMHKNIYKYFNGRKLIAYKVELVDIKLLGSLYFIFALDNERHVFSNYPVEREKLKFPVYLHYPKEQLLYKYMKE